MYSVANMAPDTDGCIRQCQCAISEHPSVSDPVVSVNSTDSVRSTYSVSYHVRWILNHEQLDRIRTLFIIILFIYPVLVKDVSLLLEYKHISLIPLSAFSSLSFFCSFIAFFFFQFFPSFFLFCFLSFFFLLFSSFLSLLQPSFFTLFHLFFFFL